MARGIAKSALPSQALHRFHYFVSIQISAGVSAPALLVYVVWPWRTLAAGSTSLSRDPFPGSKLGSASRHFLKRRESIARKNLELCFPHYNAQQRETLIAENFKSIGMALLETGMAGSGQTSVSVNGLTWKVWIT